MADISDIVAELRTLFATLPDIDQSSFSHYSPMMDTRKIALLIVPFEQDGAMGYAGLGKHSFVHAHRIPCEFWVKVENSNTGVAMERGRDICLQAMRLLADNPTLNGTIQQIGSAYNGTQGSLGQYNVLPRMEERGTIAYIVARLFVPIEIRETAAW